METKDATVCSSIDVDKFNNRLVRVYLMNGTALSGRANIDIDKGWLTISDDNQENKKALCNLNYVASIALR